MTVLYKSGGYASNGELEVCDTSEGLELIMGWKAKPLTIPKERLRFSNGIMSLLDKTGEQVLQEPTMQSLATTLGQIVAVFSINEIPSTDTINEKVLGLLDDLGYQEIDDKKGKDLTAREKKVSQWGDIDGGWIEPN